MKKDYLKCAFGRICSVELAVQDDVKDVTAVSLGDDVDEDDVDKEEEEGEGEARGEEMELLRDMVKEACSTVCSIKLPDSVHRNTDD